MKVAVIGAGISGLSTAFYLKKNGVDVKVFEKDKDVGGKIKTVHENGYIVETGPNGFLTNKPYTLDLAEDLGISNRLYRSSDKSRKRFIYKEGKLRRIPENIPAFLFSYLLSLKGKLRLIAEALVPAKREDVDESFSSFVRRRIGSEAFESLLDPMAAGIYAGNPDRLSMKASFPTVYVLEKKYGGLIKGLIAMMKKGKSSSSAAGPSGILMSFKNGLSELIDALQSKLNILTNADVIGVYPEGKTWKVDYIYNDKKNTETFDKVIISAPAYAASKILENLDKNLSEMLSNIEYSPISVVAMGFMKKGLGHDLDGFGFLIPRREGKKILGALWDSSVFPNRAPTDHALIRVMIGGSRQPELALKEKDELFRIALSSLRSIMGIRHYPEFVKVFRYPKGIPHYTVGHLERLERIEKMVKKYPGLYLNSNAYKGIGLNDCVHNGLLTAQLASSK